MVLLGRIYRIFLRYAEVNIALDRPGAVLRDASGTPFGEIERVTLRRNRLRVEGWAEAERMGIVNRVVSHDELMDTVSAEIDHMKRVPSAVMKLLKDTLNDVQETQGYRSNSAANVAKYLYAASAETETAKEFHDIADEEGVSAAIDWMRTAEKD